MLFPSLKSAPLVLLTLALLTACSDNKVTQEGRRPILTGELMEDSVVAEASAPPTANPPAARVVVSDSAALSPRFLKDLRELSASEGGYTVRGKWLVVPGQDSVALPTELPANRPVRYSATQEGRTFTLTLTRLSYTRIRFVAEVQQGTRTMKQAAGVADLNPSFYLGADAPEDSKTQTTYGAYQFISQTPQQNFSILLDMAKGAGRAEWFAYDATGQPLPGWPVVPTLRRTALKR